MLPSCSFSSRHILCKCHQATTAIKTVGSLHLVSVNSQPGRHRERYVQSDHKTKNKFTLSDRFTPSGHYTPIVTNAYYSIYIHSEKYTPIDSKPGDLYLPSDNVAPRDYFSLPIGPYTAVITSCGHCTSSYH